MYTSSYMGRDRVCMRNIFVRSTSLAFRFLAKRVTFVLALLPLCLFIRPGGIYTIICVSSIFAEKSKELSEASDDNQRSVDFWSANSSSSVLAERTSKSASKTTSWSSIQTPEHVYSSPTSVNSKQAAFHHSDFEIALCNGRSGGPSHAHSGLSEEHEGVRFAQIGRKKDFVHIERVNGKTTNVLHGLELHTGVFNAEEQKEIVDCVYGLQRKGQNGQLRGMMNEPSVFLCSSSLVLIECNKKLNVFFLNRNACVVNS